MLVSKAVYPECLNIRIETKYWNRQGDNENVNNHNKSFKEAIILKIYFKTVDNLYQGETSKTHAFQNTQLGRHT